MNNRPRECENPVINRCPKCNAALHTVDSDCYECKLLSKIEPSDVPILDDRPRRPWHVVSDFVYGLGFPVDQVLALAISVLWLLIALVSGGIWACATMAGILAFPLALIWFSEEIGSLTGYVRGANITQESDPLVVKFLGWVFLLAIIGSTIYGVFIAPQ